MVGTNKSKINASASFRIITFFSHLPQSDNFDSIIKYLAIYTWFCVIFKWFFWPFPVHILQESGVSLFLLAISDSSFDGKNLKVIYSVIQLFCLTMYFYCQNLSWFVTLGIKLSLSFESIQFLGNNLAGDKVRANHILRENLLLIMLLFLLMKFFQSWIPPMLLPELRRNLMVRILKNLLLLLQSWFCLFFIRSMIR